MTKIVRWDTVKSDLWTLAHVNPFVQLYTLGKTAEAFHAGDYDLARTRAERGITGILIAGAGGFALANPATTIRGIKTYRMVSQSTPYKALGIVDYAMDLKKEYDRNDLETEDFLYYAIPEIGQKMIDRYTYYEDHPPEVVKTLVEAEMAKVIPVLEQKLASSKPKPSKKKPSKMPSAQKKRLWRMGLRWCKKHQRYDRCGS